MTALVLIFWAIASFIVAGAGSERKIGFFSALLLSIFLSPLMGILFVLASKRNSDEAFERQLITLLTETQDEDA